MFKKLKRALESLKPWQFHLNCVILNMYTLRKIKKGMVLEASLQGLLRIKPLSFKYLLKNALFFNVPQKRVQKALEYTFLAFCHENKNPLEVRHLRLVRKKTVELAKTTLEKVKLLEFESSFILMLESHILQYEKATLIQERTRKKIAKGVKKSMASSKLWLDENLTDKKPLIPSSGCSGSYVIHGKKKVVAGIFKPFDEEIGAPNNPRGRSLRGTFGSLSEYGIRIGECIHREVAAYIIDNYLKLNIVPETCYVELKHDHFYEVSQGKFLQEEKKKQGSFQEFAVGYHLIHELSRKEVERIPFDQMHRLMILDTIIGNIDRNVGNVLTNGRKVVAIDHGLSLSSKHYIGRSFHWENWPQMKMPFFPYLLDAILNINIKKLCNKLRKECFIDICSLERMIERITLLQEAVKHGMNASKIILLFNEKNLTRLQGLTTTLTSQAKHVISESL